MENQLQLRTFLEPACAKRAVTSKRAGEHMATKEPGKGNNGRREVPPPKTCLCSTWGGGGGFSAGGQSLDSHCGSGWWARTASFSPRRGHGWLHRLNPGPVRLGVWTADSASRGRQRKTLPPGQSHSSLWGRGGARASWVAVTGRDLPSCCRV